MWSMNVILLSDFSKASAHMQDYAATLFENQPVKFTILHIKTPCKKLSCSGKCSFIYDQKLLAEKERLQGKFCEISVDTEFIEGAYIESIRHIITEKQIDLIMLGNSTKDNFKNDFFFDKKTLEIITKVKCSVILVPKQSKLKLPQTALLPTDFSVTSDYSIFNILNSMSFVDQIELSLLQKSFDENLEPNKLQSKNLISRVIHSLNFKSVNENNSNAKFACINGFDLVMVMAKNLSVFKDLFSISSESKCLPEVPILFLHDSRKI